jgi:hypothetical protein
MRAFEEAAAFPAYRREAELRLHITATIISPERASSMAVLECALRSGRCGWHGVSAENVHRALAFGYSKLGCPAADDMHMVQAMSIACRMELIEYVTIARNRGVHRYLRLVICTSLRLAWSTASVARCSARLWLANKRTRAEPSLRPGKKLEEQS